jgi:hypothetical protein
MSPQSLAFRPWRQTRQTPSALPIEPKPLRKMKPGTQTNAYIGRSYFLPGANPCILITEWLSS